MEKKAGPYTDLVLFVFVNFPNINEAMALNPLSRLRTNQLCKTLGGLLSLTTCHYSDYWQEVILAFDEQINDLMSQVTLEEKVGN